METPSFRCRTGNRATGPVAYDGPCAIYGRPCAPYGAVRNLLGSLHTLSGAGGPCAGDSPAPCGPRTPGRPPPREYPEGRTSRQGETAWRRACPGPCTGAKAAPVRVGPPSLPGSRRGGPGRRVCVGPAEREEDRPTRPGEG